MCSHTGTDKEKESGNQLDENTEIPLRKTIYHAPALPVFNMNSILIRLISDIVYVKFVQHHAFDIYHSKTYFQKSPKGKAMPHFKLGQVSLPELSLAPGSMWHGY